jgi:uncharacterized membrane protein
MYTPLIIGLIVFATILAGAFAGWVLRQRLGCHGFGVGAWAADLKCKHLVQYARGRSDGAIGAD